MAAKGLPGVRFLPVVMSHVVNLKWHEWNRHAWPPKLPIGEPENYIRGKKHDPRTAAETIRAAAPLS